MALLGEPNPLQPTDTADRMLTLEASVYGAIDYLERVEFECAKCKARYWRTVEHREIITEVIEIEGVGKYGLNPHMENVYEPIPHHCIYDARESGL